MFPLHISLAGVSPALASGFGIRSAPVTYYSRLPGKNKNNLSIDSNTEVSLQDDNTIILVKNAPGAAFPSAGDAGTRLFYLFGALLALGAIVLLTTRRITKR